MVTELSCVGENVSKFCSILRLLAKSILRHIIKQTFGDTLFSPVLC